MKVMFPGWSFLHNYDYASNERIWMIWKDIVKVSLIGVFDQSITTCVDYDSKQFILCGIYGSNEGMDKRLFWRHLE